MKVRPRKTVPPSLPANDEIIAFSKKLIDKDSIAECRSAVTACAALTLAIAPDNERNAESFLFYLENLISPTGITHTVFEAVGLWLGGLPLDSGSDTVKEQVYKNFRGAYLFSWQKRLIELAIDSYNELCCCEHPSELCEIAYRKAVCYFS